MNGWSVTYVGEGVVSNELGAFGRFTTAYTHDEELAKRLFAEGTWEVVDPSGNALQMVVTPVAEVVEAQVVQVVSESAPPAPPKPRHGHKGGYTNLKDRDTTKDSD